MVEIIFSDRAIILYVAFIAGFFALAQIKANNITNARIRWLENFRTLISDFFAECTIVLMKKGIEKGIEEESRITEKTESIKAFLNRINESKIEHLRVVNLKYDLIRMNLNPKEKLHRKFELLLSDYIGLFNKIPIADDNYSDLVKSMDRSNEKLILLVRFMMKLEWDKAKKSYLCRVYYMNFGKGKKYLTEAMLLNWLLFLYCSIQ